MKELEKIIELGKKIGLNTLSDYKLFQQTQVNAGETMVEALERYIAELGKEFKGVKE